MTVARYALGMAAIAVLAASLGLAALTLRRRFMPLWTGALARLGETTIGIALLICELELLGTVRLFRLVPIVVGAVLIALGVTRSAGQLRATPAKGRPSTTRRCAIAIAALTVGVLLAEWAAPTLDAYDHGIRTFDSLWYHLPWAASYAQTGQVTTLRFTDVEYLTAFYPATAEMLHGLGIVLLGRDTLSPGVNLVWLGLVLLAAWCVGRPRGVAPATLLGAALAMATPMVRFSQAGSAANDVVGLFFLLAALAFVLEEGQEGRRAGSGLAALACGLAVSVKLSMVVPALAIALAGVAVSASGTRRTASARWLGGLVLGGGFWYVRNLVAVGNPLPWVDLPGLATPAPALQAHTGFSVAHYLTDTALWSSTFAPGLLVGLGDWWPGLLAIAVLGALLVLARGDDVRIRAAGAVALVALAAYLITPESAAGPAGDPLGFAFNLRYATPGLTLCLAVSPLVPPLRRRPLREVTVGVLGLLLVATVAQARLWPGNRVGGEVVIGAVAAAVAGLAMARPPRRPVVLLGAAGLSAVVIGGYLGQRHYLRGRYVFPRSVSSLAGVWSYFRGVHHARVGVVGTFGGFFSYPLSGLDDSNRVSYVAAHGAHGSFTPITSCGAWRTAVDRASLQYLVTTPARDPWHPRRLSASPEYGWTASDPAAHAVYRIHVEGQPIAVFALAAPLSPAGCRR